MKTFLQILFFFLLVMQICFAQWVQLGLDDKAIKDIAARNSNIFAITSDSAMYRSIDSGINWLEIVDIGAIDIAVSSSVMIFMVKKSEPIWGYPTSSLFSSFNNGDIWDTLSVVKQLQPVPGGWPAWPTNISVSPAGLVFCGIFVTHDVGGQLTVLALSTDDGATWNSPGWDIVAGKIFDYSGQSIITYGLAGGPGWINHPVHLSSDNGQAWMHISSTFVAFANTLNLCSNGNIFCGGEQEGLFLSTDSCSSWTQVSSLNPEAVLSIESGGILVGTDNLGLFLFSDNGDSLGSRNEGLTNLNIHTFTIDNNNYIYTGTDNGVWRRPLSEIVTSVEENQIQVPSDFNLSQNYPNPFNPSTKLSYSITQSGLVTLIVYDVLGNEIKTLVNEEKPGGKYELNWNAANLPSGIYFYRLQAGDFVQTRKMILLK